MNIAIFALAKNDFITSETLMAHEKHPLETINEWLEERGLAVINGVTSFPVYGEPYVSPNLVIALNHRGWLEAEYDMHPVRFEMHDNAVVYPGHILTAYRSSDDYLCTLLVVSPKFLDILSQLHPNHYLFQYHYNASFHVSVSQYETMVTCLEMLGAISKLNHPERDMLLSAQMDIVARIVRNILHENGKVLIRRDTGVQQLLSRFHEAVAAHYCESREVNFYATLLHLSPKYFGTVVRDATGIGVGEWIARYVIIQAKFLLRHHPELSIQQVSGQIGFKEHTTLSRYFKTHAGMSPKEYREMSNN